MKAVIEKETIDMADIEDLIAANVMLEDEVQRLLGENKALQLENASFKAAQATERNLAQGNTTGFYLLCPVQHGGQTVTSADLTTDIVQALQALGCGLLKPIL